MRSDNDRNNDPDKARNGKPKNKDKNVGDALRAVYREAVSEEVPDEMIDLLKKLG